MNSFYEKQVFGISILVECVESNTNMVRQSTEEEWTLLPDGTKQPLNIFECLESILKPGGREVDLLGLETLGRFFAKSGAPIQR